MTRERAPVNEIPRTVERFTRRQRIEHWIVVALFLLLTLTGLPQKFSETDWAGWMTRGLGGLDLMRWLHRVTGLAFSAFTVYFIGHAGADILRGRTAPTMVPFLSDLKEVFQGLMWAAGLGEKPRAGRFDYREKLEFWGMFIGSLLMVVTGLMLYFPLWTARLLPGEVIPAAKTAHSYEAMLALMVIVVWHLYNTIFRPSVFPLDRTMITGRISVERLKEEHPLEYERLFPEEGRAGGDPPPPE